MPAFHIDSVNGDDSNPGCMYRPWQSSANVESEFFAPGDSILVKRGTALQGRLAVHSPGAAENPITVGVYGIGANPVLVPGASDYETIYCDAPYVHFFRGLNVTINDKPDATGVRIEAEALGNSVSFLTVIGHTTANRIYGIQTRAPDTVITNNSISKVSQGVRALNSAVGTPATYLISQNNIYTLTGGDPDNSDGISIVGVNEPDCTGAVVSYNDISGHQEDGIDIWQCTGLVVEHNTIHDPIMSAEREVSGIRSKGIPGGTLYFRHNTITDILSPASAGFGFVSRVGGYVIEDNYVKNITSRCVSLYQGANAQIYSNTLQDAPIGINCGGATMTEWDNEFINIDDEIKGCS